MTGARYVGSKKWTVKIGNHKVLRGQVVGEPGSECDVEGCPGVVDDLLRRADFEYVTEIPDETPDETNEE